MRKLYILGLSAVALLAIGIVWADEFTISTYYPAPFGVYREMRIMRTAIGDTYHKAGDHPWDEDGGSPEADEIHQDADLVVEGNIGIGMINPQTALDVTGSSVLGGADPHGVINITSNAPYISFNDTDQVSDRSVWRAGVWNRHFLIAQDNYDLSTIEDHFVILRESGNVGIGDGTYPDAKLEVADSDTDYFMVSSDADGDGDMFIVDNLGNVGIGTTEPKTKLDVEGLIRVARYSTAARPAAVPDNEGAIYYDTDDDKIYYSDGTDWFAMGGGGGGGIVRLASATIYARQVIPGNALPYALPTITQGTQLFLLSAQASNASSKISLRGNIQAYTGYGNEPPMFTIWKDGILLSSVIGAVPISGVAMMDRTTFEVEIPAVDTSSHVYQVRVGCPNARDIDINNTTWSGTMGGTMTSIFVVEEILP